MHGYGKEADIEAVEGKRECRGLMNLRLPKNIKYTVLNIKHVYTKSHYSVPQPKRFAIHEAILGFRNKDNKYVRCRKQKISNINDMNNT